jgi:hypothetical protein
MWQLNYTLRPLLSQPSVALSCISAIPQRRPSTIPCEVEGRGRDGRTRGRGSRVLAVALSRNVTRPQHQDEVRACWGTPKGQGPRSFELARPGRLPCEASQYDLLSRSSATFPSISMIRISFPRSPSIVSACFSTTSLCRATSLVGSGVLALAQELKNFHVPLIAMHAVSVTSMVVPAVIQPAVADVILDS